eukprot:scaffold10292_cov119-Skeletonema_dohrnii-CCMP3373.AAC.11
MASKAARIAAVANQIFGTVPNRGVRTGMQYLKKPLTGAYEARYYMEPIEPIARKKDRSNTELATLILIGIFRCRGSAR